MIALDDPIWSELWHCHGTGDGVPPLLKKLESSKRPNKKFLADFADILYHQCSRGTASVAAFPHLIRIAADNISSKKGFDTISIAAFLLTYVLGSEGNYDSLYKLDSTLREPFITAIADGQALVSAMMFSTDRDFSATADLLAIVAAFAKQPRLCLALDIQRRAVLMCPDCESEFPIDRLFTF